MNGEIYLTVQEAAKIASMADETIRRAIRKGYLHATAPAAGPGRGKFRITRSELDRWIRGEPDTTEYLLKSPANAARLMEAFNDWRAGRNLQERDLLPDDD
jgi:excisionase family DNA binding protein